MILLMDASMSAPFLLYYFYIIPDFCQSWKVCHHVTDTESTQASKFTRLLIIIDATGCQKKIAASVPHEDADYLL